ncbi:stalk domain-containing protein [Peptoniphilus mikwangii]|uniref:stalk domain-containing protein n=1 Tax=Peptoniphilus mikwangii TaxID=1354300 RepID=UPI0004243DEA|nr:stalk domain-containing protein [Peptoniphilus mikwangii]
MNSKLHKILAILLMSIIILVDVSPVIALEEAWTYKMETSEVEIIKNPNYDYYLNHRDEFKYGYVPPKTLFPVAEPISGRRSKGDIPVPEKYDAREIGLISPVKNQNSTGTCWAHASMSSVETALKKSGDVDFCDFSELHLVHNTNKSTNLQDGGNIPFAMSYFSRLNGPKFEKDFPSTDSVSDDEVKVLPGHTIMEDFSKKSAEKQVGDMIVINKSEIKKFVMEYGAVIGSYHHDESGFIKDLNGIVDKTRYHLKKSELNHAVTIIGWDDSKKITDEVVGAYLIKNSWGTNFGDNGYFWVSYETFPENVGGKQSNYYVLTDVRDKVADNVYQYDEYGVAGFDGFKTLKTFIFANEFDKQSAKDEIITDIAFYNCNAKNTEFTVYIVERDDWKSKKLSNLSEENKVATGNINHSGYYTVPLENPRHITKNKFVIIMQLETDTEGVYAGLAATDTGEDKKPKNKKSYYWTGMSFNEAIGCMSLNAYSKVVLEEYTITINSSEGGIVKANKYKAKKGEEITLTIEPKEGYELDKIEVKKDDEEIILTSDNKFIMPEGNTIITAKFKEKPAEEYTVTIINDGNGNASADIQKGKTGTEVTLSATANSGYKFKEWQVINGDVTVSNNKFNIGNKDVEIKAVFEKISPNSETVKIIFDSNGGSFVPTQSIEKNTKAIRPTDPIRFGYTFMGWYRKFNQEELFNFNEKINEDTILIAKWEKNYNITPDPYYSKSNTWKTINATQITKTEEKKTEIKQIELKTTIKIGSKTLEKSINGKSVSIQMDVAPYIENGRTMLPIRFVAETLGFEVEWNNNTRTVILKNKDNTVELPIGTNKIIVNSVEYTSDVKTVIKDDRTFLPVANIARVLGMKDGKDVVWDELTKEVTIIKKLK